MHLDHSSTLALSLCSHPEPQQAAASGATSEQPVKRHLPVLQQQQPAATSSDSAHQPAPQQQLQSRASAEGLQRVNSPGPYIQFDAAAYAAAAAARTASPGQLVCRKLGRVLATSITGICVNSAQQTAPYVPRILVRDVCWLTVNK